MRHCFNVYINIYGEDTRKILIICMSLVKTLCGRCWNCLRNCFKSEEDELHEKMIELENKIRTPIPDRSHKFKIKETSWLIQPPDWNNRSQNNNNKQQEEDAFSFGESPKNRFEVQHLQNKQMPESLNLEKKNSLTSRQRNMSLTRKTTQLDKKQEGNSALSPSSPNNRNSNNSSDSFFTMQSGSLGSSNSISRRTFISLSKKSSELRKGILLKSRSKGSGDQDFKSMQNRESMMPGLPSLLSADSKVQKYSQSMIEWNQKQYELYTNAPFRIGSQPKTRINIQQFLSDSELSNTQLHKLNSNSWLDQLVNKLEDYYMFFQPEEMLKAGETPQSSTNSSNNQNYSRQKKQTSRLANSAFSGFTNMNKEKEKVPEANKSTNNVHYKYLVDKGYYVNPVNNFKCSYQCESDSVYDRDYAVQAHIPVNFMKLITFNCNTSNPLQFLYWFNSTEVRARLYDFNNTLLIANGIYPTFYVEQYSGLLPNKNKYQMVRQIELVKFQNEPDKEYIMQLDCTYGGGAEENILKFKSLLRFEIGENSMVEIYSESSEQIERGTHGNYFGQQWRNLEQKLIRDKMLKPLWKSSLNYPRK